MPVGAAAGGVSVVVPADRVQPLRKGPMVNEAHAARWRDRSLRHHRPHASRRLRRQGREGGVAHRHRGRQQPAGAADRGAAQPVRRIHHVRPGRRWRRQIARNRGASLTSSSADSRSTVPSIRPGCADWVSGGRVGCSGVAWPGTALPAKDLRGNNCFKVVVDWARWCSSTRGGMRCR